MTLFLQILFANIVLLFVLISVHELGHWFFGRLVGIPSGQMRIRLLTFPQQVQIRDSQGWVSVATFDRYFNRLREIVPSRSGQFANVVGGFRIRDPVFSGLDSHPGIWGLLAIRDSGPRCVVDDVLGVCVRNGYTPINVPATAMGRLHDLVFSGAALVGCGRRLHGPCSRSADSRGGVSVAMVTARMLCERVESCTTRPNQALPSNGGGPSRLQAARFVAAVAELGSLGRPHTL